MLSLAIWSCMPAEPGRAVQSAEPAACLALPAGMAVPADDERTWLVDGVATAHAAVDGATFSDGVRCDAAVRQLTITDAGGADWQVGYGWSDGGPDATPAMAVLPGETVSLLFRSVPDGAAGFVVRGGGHVLAAVEVGAWGPALDPADVGLLTVGEGEVVGADRDDCGRRVSRDVRFVGDEEVLVEPVGQAILRVDGSELVAWALAAWAWEDSTCPDLAGELSWALWRKAVP